MKLVVLSLIAVPTIILAVSPDLTLYNATRYGAEVKTILRVIDQDGLPVYGAKVSGGFQTGGNLKDSIPIRGGTDTNGEYVVQGKVTRIFHCEVSKAEYYTSIRDFMYGSEISKDAVKDGKWQPYGTTQTFILRKIVSPRLSGKRFIAQPVPAFDKWLGYDLELCDWIEPDGQGKNNDVRIRITARDSGGFDFNYKMELSFEHIPFAGAYTRISEPIVGSWIA